MRLVLSGTACLKSYRHVLFSNGKEKGATLGCPYRHSQAKWWRRESLVSSLLTTSLDRSRVVEELARLVTATVLVAGDVAVLELAVGVFLRGVVELASAIDVAGVVASFEAVARC